MVGHRNISLRFLPWSSQIGSCVLKADSRLIYRPILSQYDGRDSGDISTDMNRHACWLTPGRYFAATRPTLRSFGQLFLLSSIFCIQLLIIFSSPLGGAFNGRRPFLAFHFGNIIYVVFLALFFPRHRFCIRTSLQ